MSKDKKGLMLNTENMGKEVIHPGSIIKDPFVLEFLDLKESEHLTESRLESVLIEKLQHFILELGKRIFFCWPTIPHYNR